MSHPTVPQGPHGGEAGAVARAIGLDRSDLVDLSVSLNPFAPPLDDVLSEQLGAIRDYPDVTLAEHELATELGVDAARLVLTNGGAEAIALVAALQPQGRVDDPEFSLYARHLSSIADGAPRWRSNPSNPLGKLRSTAASSAVNRCDVWDEAFYPLATGSWTDRTLVDAGVWQLGSLTKLWSCPGLRLGYALAPDIGSADQLRAIQPRWSVNGLALAAVAPMLELTDLVGWSTQIAALRARFGDAVRCVGYRVIDTDVNWVLIDDAPGLRSQLLEHGVLVRDCSSFGLAGTARVALPRPEEFDRVVTAFERVAT